MLKEPGNMSVRTDKPTITIDYDLFGHCVLCHKYMLTQAVIDCQVINRFDDTFREGMVVLSDGSPMRISLCDCCYDNYTEEDYEKMYASILKGWEVEMKANPKFDDERIKNYMDRYNKKKIIFDTRGLTQAQIEKRVKEYLKDGSNN
jgi:hypothetical protein